MLRDTRIPQGRRRLISDHALVRIDDLGEAAGGPVIPLRRRPG
jgi:hypothetical protein